MQSVMAFLVVVLCLFVVVQGVENSSQSATEDMGQSLAKEHACDIDSACVLKGGPSVTKSDAFRRRYQFTTDQGSVTVTCTREHIWVGPWSCRSERGSIM